MNCELRPTHWPTRYRRSLKKNLNGDTGTLSWRVHWHYQQQENLGLSRLAICEKRFLSSKCCKLLIKKNVGNNEHSYALMLNKTRNNRRALRANLYNAWNKNTEPRTITHWRRGRKKRREVHASNLSISWSCRATSFIGGLRSGSRAMHLSTSSLQATDCSFCLVSIERPFSKGNWIISSFSISDMLHGVLLPLWVSSFTIKV